MSVSTSYPGIYIQELPSNSHAIVPAPTSIAAFVGYSHPFQTAAFNVAQQCFSFSDYVTYFGPLFSSGLVDASLPRAVYQFFLNGGSTAWVLGLQPGLFGADDTIIARLGSADGGTNINALISTSSTAAGGGISGAVSLPVNAGNPTPVVAQISPASITMGNPSFVLTVTGSNFVPKSAVTWNGTALPTTYIDSTTLAATVPEFEIKAGLSPTAVTIPIAVTSPAPGGGTSGTSRNFTLNVADQTPELAGISPATATVGQPFTLTVNGPASGADFVPGSTVMWEAGGTPTALQTTYVSDSVLTAIVPAAMLAGPGTVKVSVVTADAGTPQSAQFDCVVGNTYPVAKITSLAPKAMTAGSAAFTVIVTGSNFFPSSVVNWNGLALATNYVSNTQLSALVGASAIAGAVSVNVTVTNPEPGGGPSADYTGFTIAAANPGPPALKISSLSPASAVVGGGATLLTVTGAGFVPGSVVQWAGAPLATSYVSDSELTATIPAANLAAASAGVDITVGTPTGAGLVLTAMELTDIVAMTVTITNVRNGGGTFDAIITYGARIETYRGLQLAGSGPQSPASIINAASKLVQVAPGPLGYGTGITAQQATLSLGIPANLVTCFSASDFLDGDGTTIAVFEANSSLDNVEIFNLLLVPGITDFSIVSAALAFAERKRAFMIVDPPPQAPAFGISPTPQPIQYWMTGLYGGSYELPLSQNGALYFPYLISNDPVTTSNVPMAPSGFVAGIYAQTDASRGVWKAPAGLATNLLNTSGPVLTGAMNDPQQGVLNLDSINCLRSFSGVGTVVWGARTLVAANDAYQQWMYVPVRRMTLFIEQTLLANLRWVVFEPNDEPLWIAITSSINAFMLSLFRQGALQGTTPSDAFLVTCDSTTTTPANQAQGIVNIVVAFAPLKPAEFVVIQIAQLAGQTAGS